MGYTPIITRPRDGSGAAYSGDPVHVTGTGLVASGPTYFGAVVINDPGSSWVLTVYDGVDSSGGASAIKAVIKPSASGGNFVYDCRMKTGIYIASSGTTAGDATVVCSTL